MNRITKLERKLKKLEDKGPTRDFTVHYNKTNKLITEIEVLKLQEWVNFHSISSCLIRELTESRRMFGEVATENMELKDTIRDLILQKNNK